MKHNLLFIIIILFSFNAEACSCSFSWNDSFGRTAKHSKFVALVKIISFDEYLEDPILGYRSDTPYSMTAEIIKKYKGTEERKTITIVGDNGMLCRPYLSNFKINQYYLVAPNLVYNSTEYEFFFCRTDYLTVNISKNKAYGNYSFFRKQVNISTFESKLKYGDWDAEIIILISIILILSLLIIRKKRNSNQIKHDDTSSV